MQIHVNGRTLEVADDLTVAGLLAHLKTDAARVAVERNQDVVPRATWADCRLAAGDQIEIVTFVGGG
jgi:thiamine biosynthesis protein ThiS